ncbi:REP-associated tyrosine transposase [Paludisphaera rhizosphaerae]|uniref:REP-associated tyrosine transposase n=1 Tax=Paludisphaera rhizosphaerae TaxID=2711216 RepID=UPI0013EB0A4A|nr:transposase [Paludisphaera rhizosphaerae]
MGRSLRLVEDGLVYHAINRGNNRDVVFLDDDDHAAFLDALGRTQAKYPFRLFGYCLMSNHFHLLLRPEEGVSISRVLQSLTVTHTWRYHRRRRTSGHVWQGRFKSPVVQDEGHLLTVLRYIEANPLRAGMVEDPTTYRWSSAPAHATGLANPLLAPFPEWDALGRDERSRQSAWRRKLRGSQPEAEILAIRTSLRTGLPFGEPEWADSLAAALGRTPPRPRGRPRKAEE